MFSYLRRHPQIYLPLRKEVHYFGSDLERVPGTPWFVTRECEYYALFEEAADGQVVGEASVLYLYSSRAAEEISAFRPDAKILIQLRNPIDMMYSYHGQNLLAVQEDIDDFQEAYAAVDDRRRHHRIPRWCIMYQQLLYPDVARYAAQVRRYLEAFGRDRVHVMFYEDFRRDPADEFARVLEFLGVDPTFRPNFDAVNSPRRVRSRRLQGEAQLPSLPTRLLLRMLPDEVEYKALIHLSKFNSYAARRPPLPREFRAKLAREFADEVGELGELMQRDLSHWIRTDSRQ